MNRRILLGAFLTLSAAISGTFENEILDFDGDDSGDYIIRWAFQEKCDHVHDMITSIWQWPTSETGVTFNPADVQPGGIVFARKAPEFFETVHPQIKNPYIMVTMGEWRESVQDSWLDYLDDEKIIAWFSIHACERVHPKFYPLPIGLFQQKDVYDNRVNLKKLFAELRTRPKTKLLYSNYGDMFNKKADRKELDDYMKDKPWCTYSKNIQGLEFPVFMKEMADFKFALSPRGYGIDCYRTWEALLVGSIPIVRHSQLDPLYEGLPILVIDDWKELTEEFLNEKYKEIVSKKYDIAPLFIKYWFKKMKRIRKAYFAKHPEKR